MANIYNNTLSAEFNIPNEEAMLELGRELSLFLNIGDIITMEGDLGAGKTVLARSIINSLLPPKLNGSINVPSPSYTLVQSYNETRIPVTHFDFYRLTDTDEIAEIGFEDAIFEGVIIAEWPKLIIDSGLVPNRLEVHIAHEEGDQRTVVLNAHGSYWIKKLDRIDKARIFLNYIGFANYERIFLQGDASNRRYERLCSNNSSNYIFMDMPEKDDHVIIRNGKTYSEINNLAVDVYPFIAVGEILRKNGFSVPETIAQKPEDGFLIIEDFGNKVFRDLIDLIGGLENNSDLSEEYQTAIDVLIDIYTKDIDANYSFPGSDKVYIMPNYDFNSFMIEVELLVDWFVPYKTGSEINKSDRSNFITLWQDIFAKFTNVSEEIKTVPVLRDYHSPNLIWLPNRAGNARIGIIDYQDAVLGHPAYDLVSLLQDARTNIPDKFRKKYYSYYISMLKNYDSDFDVDAFKLAYDILGAQRNSKILGIFARLARRDGKEKYLSHVPRVIGYLKGNLSNPNLKELANWYKDKLIV